MTESDHEKSMVEYAKDNEDRVCSTIDKIIELLPDVYFYYSNDKIKESVTKLQKAIYSSELEFVFNQPPTEEDLENRRIIKKIVSKDRKDGNE